MQGLEGHYFRFTSDELFNGVPARLVDKWSIWGIKAAVGYNSQLMANKTETNKKCIF